MNAILNEKQLTLIERYEFDKPLLHKVDSINVSFIRDCHKKLFPYF